MTFSLHRKLSAIALAATLAVSLGACSEMDQKTGEELLTKGYETSSKASRVALCQGRAVADSKLPQHLADKILKAGDPAQEAKKFGYKQLGNKLKKCYREQFPKKK